MSITECYGCVSEKTSSHIFSGTLTLTLTLTRNIEGLAAIF